MMTLSADKISSLLSIPGNNKCLECDNTSIEWVSFPTSIFYVNLVVVSINLLPKKKQ